MQTKATCLVLVCAARSITTVRCRKVVLLGIALQLQGCTLHPGRPAFNPNPINTTSSTPPCPLFSCWGCGCWSVVTYPLEHLYYSWGTCTCTHDMTFETWSNCACLPCTITMLEIEVATSGLLLPWTIPLAFSAILPHLPMYTSYYLSYPGLAGRVSDLLVLLSPHI